MLIVIRFGDDAPLLSYIVYDQEYTRLSTLETGMKRCRVKKFVTSTGEEMAILRTADGSPAFWPNLYATWKLRSAGLSPETTSSILRSIGMAEDWSAPSGQDFSDRL
jgi:hypothetical protein